MKAHQAILIVDDRPENLFALEKTLAEVDADVVKAGDGNSALTLCLNRDFALAILDVQMPGMDGYELASLLRDDERTARMPIIFLTAAYLDEQHVFRGYESGAVDYITKPYEPSVMLGKVRVFLELDRQRAELQDHRDHLERLVRARTAELERSNADLAEEVVRRRASEEDLRRSIAERDALQAGLIKTDRLASIGLLAAGVAHEINNPIHIVMNYAELIAEEAQVGSDAERSARAIVEAGQRMAAIVRNLLLFARQEKEQYSPARLADVVQSTVTLARKVLQKDMIDIAVEVSPDLPRLQCRSGQLAQVVMNLLTNARDALNARYPGSHADKRVAVVARQTAIDDRAAIRLTVEDRGVGIPADVMDHIFDPFFTTKPRDKGTGLGLSLSLGIVQEHGGRISVESEPGLFTRFHVDLPVDNGWIAPGIVDDAAGRGESAGG